jgi:hypothetical protein
VIQINLIQFLAIRWSILITFGSYLVHHNLWGTRASLAHWFPRRPKMALQTFYFDMKDGVPIRDRIGKRFALNAEAIDHSKRLAARFRSESGHDEPDLTISVLDETGREIHRKLVHPMVPT